MARKLPHKSSWRRTATLCCLGAVLMWASICVVFAGTGSSHSSSTALQRAQAKPLASLRFHNTARSRPVRHTEVDTFLNPSLLFPGLHHPELIVRNQTEAAIAIASGLAAAEGLEGWRCDDAQLGDRKFLPLNAQREKPRQHAVDYYGGPTAVRHFCVAATGEIGGWPGAPGARLDGVLYLHRAGDESLGDASVNAIDSVSGHPSVIAALFTGSGVLPAFTQLEANLSTFLEDGALKPVLSQVSVTFHAAEPSLCEMHHTTFFLPLRQYEVEHLDAPGSLPLDIVADLAGLLRTSFLTTPDGTLAHDGVELVVYALSSRRFSDALPHRLAPVRNAAFLDDRGSALGWMLRRLTKPIRWRAFASGNRFVGQTCFAKVIFPLSGYNFRSTAPHAAGGGEAHPAGPGWSSLREQFGFLQEAWPRTPMVTTHQVVDEVLWAAMEKMTNKSSAARKQGNNEAFVGHVNRVVKLDGTVVEQHLQGQLVIDTASTEPVRRANVEGLAVHRVTIRVGVLQDPTLPSNLFKSPLRQPRRWVGTHEQVKRMRTVDPLTNTMMPIRSLRRRLISSLTVADVNGFEQRRVLEIHIEAIAIDPSKSGNARDFSRLWLGRGHSDSRGPSVVPENTLHNGSQTLQQRAKVNLHRLDQMAALVRQLDVFVLSTSAVDLYAGWAGVLPQRSVVVEVSPLAAVENCSTFDLNHSGFGKRCTKWDGSANAVPFAFRAAADASSHLQHRHLFAAYRTCASDSEWRMTDAAFKRLVWVASCARLRKLVDTAGQSESWEWPLTDGSDRRMTPLHGSELPTVCGDFEPGWAIDSLDCSAP